MSRAEKWAAGIAASVIAASIVGAVSAHAQVTSRISTLEERTASLSEMHEDITHIREDVAAICARLDIRRER